MVCEVPRARQLLLRKKGLFFEDPFFSDVWDDYNHAVRRIVDRFNRGWVSPSDRLRDSQYHSMYRTLRNARLNYSTHSARFKEEGEVYKLVMDVREFIGGDITVRTAGGTVSVRGKVEVNSDGERKAATKDDDDDTSTISGRSSSAKTLHRRFTLPADANCEKIESSLSRDAVLTVTIPKRTDIHYIPVNIEGEDNKENKSNSGARGVRDALRQPSVKRPNDSPPERHRKKSQDESASYRRRRRQENDEGVKEKEDRPSRRRSKECEPPSDAPKSEFERERERARLDEVNGKPAKRNRESRDQPMQSDRRRESKYEDVQEINIPVRINKNEASDKIFRPSSVYDPVIHNIEIQRDLSTDQESDIEIEKEKPHCSELKDNRNGKCDISELTHPVNSPRFRELSAREKDQEEDKEHKGRANWGNKDWCQEKLDGGKEKLLRSIHGPARTKESNASEDVIENDSVSRKESLPSIENESVSRKELLPSIENESVSRKESLPSIENESVSRKESLPSIDVKNYSYPNEKSVHSGIDSEEGRINSKLILNHSTDTREPQISKEDPDAKTEVDHEEAPSLEEWPKDKLATPRTSLFERPSSPVSPGSRVVKVEEDSSLMEEGMFKDCWSDFSNTLQDVLSRLQELSSELSQSKILAATTPSAENSPPSAETGSFLERTADDGLKAPASTYIPQKSYSSSFDKSNLAHGLSSNVGGVGGNKGGAKDDNESAHFPWRTGQGYCESGNLDIDETQEKLRETTQEAQKVSGLSDNPSPISVDHGINDPYKAERPSSLLLRNVASPQRKNLQEKIHDESPSSSSRPNSLFLNDATSGTLLESLRKNSPVELLQENFLRRTSYAEPSDSYRTANFVPVEVEECKAVPVGGPRKEEERSASLSPSDWQSNAELVRSESEFGTNCALENIRGINSESSAAKKDCCDSDEFASESLKGSFLNDLGASPILQKTQKEDSSRNLVFEPNIDTSPESNITDESVGSSPEEDAVHGHFSFPSFAKVGLSERKENQTHSRYKAPLFPSDVTALSDVTASTLRANENRPKIPSDDEMVCERPLPPNPRLPRKDAKHEPLRFSRINKPRDLLLQEERGDVDSSCEPNGVMGGVLARGRKTPRTPESHKESSAVKSSSAYSSSPSERGTKQALPPEESSLPPPYVRLRSEPSKRYSGFAHINSDNVRRMRDVWGTKQDSSPSRIPPSSNKIPPPSPTKVSSRRSSDANDRRSPARSQTSESPRVDATYPSSERSSYPFNRSSPSPDRGNPSSPSYLRNSKNKIFRDSPPPSPKHKNNNTSKPSTPIYSNNYSRRGSQASQDRSSPVPPSPCRRCSRGAKDSATPSPSVERKQKFSYEPRTREQQDPRPKHTPSSSTSPRASSDHHSKTKENVPRASKVHQKIFKRLRNASLQPDSEAICFKEEDDKYKMVLDVEEFVSGEVEVLQDDLVLTVKGRVESKDSGGHVSVKTFHRTFNIPKNSREEDIDSALSTDGILTIYVPKKRERVIKIELVD